MLQVNHFVENYWLNKNPQREPGASYGHVIEDKILNEVLFLRDYYSVYFFGNKLGYFTL